MAMTISDEATPTDVQPKKPCHDCLWRRNAVAGWLGPLTPEQWVQVAHGDGKVPCHALKGPQCAGLAIYRGNICKLPRDREALVLDADRQSVFSNPDEFLEHHKKRHRG